MYVVESFQYGFYLLPYHSLFPTHVYTINKEVVHFSIENDPGRALWSKNDYFPQKLSGQIVEWLNNYFLSVFFSDDCYSLKKNM